MEALGQPQTGTSSTRGRRRLRASPRPRARVSPQALRGELEAVPCGGGKQSRAAVLHGDLHIVTHNALPSPGCRGLLLARASLAITPLCRRRGWAPSRLTQKVVKKKADLARNVVGVGATGSPGCWPGELPWVPPSSACCGHGAGGCRDEEERGELALGVLWDPWAGATGFVGVLPPEPPASIAPTLHPAARSPGALAANLCAVGCWVGKTH